MEEQSVQRKPIRLDLINTFWYDGQITEYKEPKAIIKDGRLYTSRSIIIRKDISGTRQSSIIMHIPRVFNERKIEVMIKREIPARFHFCLHIVQGKDDSFYNTIFCLSIEPYDKKWIDLRQEIIYDPYKIRTNPKNFAPHVDEDGYAFPYDY